MQQGMVLIVSGPPAAGKTTLAAKLGAALGWPVFGRDAIKETLFDTLGYRDREWSRTVGVASVRLLFDIITREIAAGRCIVAESNFHHAYDVPRFDALVRRHGCAVREVHCTAAPDEIVRRYVARWERGERHPGHGQEPAAEAEAGLRNLLASGVHVPLLAPAHRIVVDTTDFAAVDDAAMVAAVRRLVGA